MDNSKRDNYVSRGALKLKYAINHFGVDVKDKIAADLGCSTGGFTEILLEKGARKVYAVDTAYGQLEWKLRQNEKVIVKERTNALHVELPEDVDIITIDVGWTAQKLIIPKALSMLKPKGQIITLVKPHYEAKNYGIKFKGKKLDKADSEKILQNVIKDLEKLNIIIKEHIESPIVGEKGKNIEYFLAIIRMSRICSAGSRSE